MEINQKIKKIFHGYATINLDIAYNAVIIDILALDEYIISIIVL